VVERGSRKTWKRQFPRPNEEDIIEYRKEAKEKAQRRPWEKVTEARMALMPLMAASPLDPLPFDREYEDHPYRRTIAGITRLLLMIGVYKHNIFLQHLCLTAFHHIAEMIEREQDDVGISLHMERLMKC
jgi:hypothetical protein